MTTSISITPNTKVAELLDAYPHLESVLIDMAPVFSRLRNPVLRRTIARVATLAKAAEIAGISARDLVSRLRQAAGLVDEPAPAEQQAEPLDEAPAPWVDAAAVRWTVDADELLAAGQHPIGEVQRRAAALNPGELGLLRSSFRPAPLLEVLANQGLRTAVVRSGDRFATFISHSEP